MKKLSLATSLLVGSVCIASPLSAEIIASESFASPSGYVANMGFGNVDQNRNNIIGTTGFSNVDTNAFRWINNTQNVRPVAGGLTHNLVQGTPVAGAALMIPTEGVSIGRSSYRNLAAAPTGSTFYMSGLVSMNGNLNNLLAHSNVAMGLSAVGTSNADWNTGAFATGFGIGLSRGAGEEVYLSAFAGGETYHLGAALNAEQADGDHMIVLRLEIGAGATDTLTGWYALAGATELTQAFSISGLDIANSGSDLGVFGAVSSRPDSSATGFGAGALLDEWRFGTSMSAVTSVPEPAVGGALLALGVLGLVVVSRRRLLKSR